jgi:hypothetical protein
MKTVRAYYGILDGGICRPAWTAHPGKVGVRVEKLTCTNAQERRLGIRYWAPSAERVWN